MLKSRFILIFFIISTIALLLSGCRGSDGAFGPIFPTPTQIGIVNNEPVPVNFETLNSDPFVFVDRFVRVTGRYVPLDQSICNRKRGPSIDWYLVSDGLEMNMSGFGSVVSIAPEQAFFTLDGIWRQYDGPVGCIKEPKDETVWYLEVVRIVDPNPLVANANTAREINITPSTNTAIDPQPQATSNPQDVAQTIVPATPPGTSIPTATPLGNAGGAENAGSTPTSTPTVFVVATLVSPTPNATVTVASGNSGTTVTPTPTLTGSVEPTVSVTVTTTPTPNDQDGNGDGLGGTGSGTPNAATPVPTQSGYPAPGEGTSEPPTPSTNVTNTPYP